MVKRNLNAIQNLSLFQQFMLASLVILVAGMLGIGAWVGKEIEQGVLNRTGATTALYVDSFLTPNLQELATADQLSPQKIDQLAHLLPDTPLGRQIVTFKIWDTSGKVLYSTDQATIGETFPLHERMLMARDGLVVSDISQLEEAENVLDRLKRSRLLETYSPVRQLGSNRVIAIAEFYQSTDELENEVRTAQQRSWLVVGGVILAMYTFLGVFMRRASDTIQRQRLELNSQVERLTELLAQNHELSQRVRRAAASVTATNERFLKRIGAELHDGPAQDLGLALLKLDTVAACCERCGPSNDQNGGSLQVLGEVQASLQNALNEMRGIAGGLALPQLADLSLAECVLRAVRAHERRTGSKVDLETVTLPEQASLPLKITLYRFIQEGLNNAFRHAGGNGQRVSLEGQGGLLNVEVSDQGAGFDPRKHTSMDEHLGLAGMRERVESLGGIFRIESQPGQGTRVSARLSLESEGANNER